MVATEDNLAMAMVHGEAWRRATERGDIAAAVSEIRAITTRQDLLAETAGISVGAWLASPSTHVGTELLVAGLCIYAGASLTELDQWVRVGYARGQHSRMPQHGTGLWDRT